MPPEITGGKTRKKNGGFRLEKTSRKNLQQLLLRGRRVTKTKAQQNYIPRLVAGEQGHVLWGGEGGRNDGVVLRTLKLNLFQV